MNKYRTYIISIIRNGLDAPFFCPPPEKPLEECSYEELLEIWKKQEEHISQMFK